MTTVVEPIAGPNRPTPMYWLLGGAVVAYVALCVGFWDQLGGADAWEHHRAIKALADEGLGYSGNPTIASEVPSIRYSPYTVALAALCRATGIDAFRALNLAAVLGTAIAALGIPYLLGAFGEARASAPALVFMLLLYGGSPGYSNSMAISDLPWHMVNPSNFSFALSLFGWGLFARTRDAGRWRAGDLALAALTAAVILNHAMTGLLLGMGLGLIALGGSRPASATIRVLAIGAAAFALCTAWPWFDFLEASTSKLPEGIVMVGSNRDFLFRICLPGVVLSAAAWCERSSAGVRQLLALGYASYLAGLLATVLPERVPVVGSMGRVPLPGLVFLHFALGIFADRAGLFRPATWPGRLRALARGDRPATASAALEVVVAASLAGFGAPLFWMVLSSPWLARPYVAPLLDRELKGYPLLPVYGRLLEPVGRHDVVLGEAESIWPVPSVSGRIVEPYHREALVRDQGERVEATRRFFDPGTPDADRLAILDAYDVRWILLDTANLDPKSLEAVDEPGAVATEVDRLRLLDADRWRAPRAVGGRPGGKPARESPADGDAGLPR